MLQKKYTVNNYLLDKNKMPSYLPSGLYKIIMLVNDGEIVSSGVEILIKVE